jgi:hypothetical protein
MWVTWYNVFHCSGTLHLPPGRVATPLPLALVTSTLSRRRCVYRASPYQRPSPRLSYFASQASCYNIMKQSESPVILVSRSICMYTQVRMIWYEHTEMHTITIKTIFPFSYPTFILSNLGTTVFYRKVYNL